MKPHEMNRSPKTRSDETQAQVPLLSGSAVRPCAQCDRVGVAGAGPENWLPAAKPQGFGGAPQGAPLGEWGSAGTQHMLTLEGMILLFLLPAPFLSQGLRAMETGASESGARWAPRSWPQAFPLCVHPYLPCGCLSYCQHPDTDFPACCQTGAPAFLLLHSAGVAVTKRCLSRRDTQ